jgi:hypothetical protein
MTDNQFEALKLSLEEDLDITKQNYHEKNLSLLNRYLIYLGIYHKEMNIFANLSSTFKTTYGNLLHYYKFDAPFKLSNSSEIEAHVESDEKYTQIFTKMKTQENFLKYIEKSLDLLKSAMYAIKTHIEYEKLSQS